MIGSKQRRKHDHSEPSVPILDDGYPYTSEQEQEEARARIKARTAREIRYVCGWRTCANYYDPVDKTTWGVGRIGCPCDNLPGWHARHPLMLPLPAWPGKARGRHGSRIQRTARRHRRVSRDGTTMRWAEGWD